MGRPHLNCSVQSPGFGLMSWEAAVDSWLLTVWMPVCGCVCARARQVFPPLSQYGCMLVLPGYRSHAVIHTNTHVSLSSEAHPELETLHTAASRLYKGPEVCQTAAHWLSMLTALSLCHHFHWKWSKLAILLAPELLAACAGSLVSSDFFQKCSFM